MVKMYNIRNFREIVIRFGILDSLIKWKKISKGLIHNTYKIYSNSGKSYILQNVTSKVFSSVSDLENNIYQWEKDAKAFSYPTLKFLKLNNGKIHLNYYDSFWRMMPFVEDAICLQNTKSKKIAIQSGALLGDFHKFTLRLKVKNYRESILNFHNLSVRENQFKNALLIGDSDRINKSQKLQQLQKELQKIVNSISLKSSPICVCHNDCKLSNILFTKNFKALMLIDIDTIMPGRRFNDLGDLLRSVASNEMIINKEDINISMHLFEYCLESYLSIFDKVSKKELNTLIYSATIMSYLHGIRALTDYILRDKYFKVSYARQNFDRAYCLLNSSMLFYDRINESIRNF